MKWRMRWAAVIWEKHFARASGNFGPSAATVANAFGKAVFIKCLCCGSALHARPLEWEGLLNKHISLIACLSTAFWLLGILFKLMFPTKPPPYDNVCSCKGLPDSCSDGCNSWSQQKAWKLGDAAIDPRGPKNAKKHWRMPIQQVRNSFFWRCCSLLPWCIPGRDSEDKLPPIEVQSRQEVGLELTGQPDGFWPQKREANQQSLGLFVW